MKKTLEKIFEHYPNVQTRFNGGNIPLTNIEDVFFQFSLFVSEPEKYSFNINLFYTYLQNEDLILGIRFIIDFFQKDTFLIKNKRDAFINVGDLENEQLYNQTTFADYLAESGLNYSPTKLGTYYRRGKLPDADVVVNGTPYWYESTVDLYTRELLNEEKNKKSTKKKIIEDNN